MRKSIWTILVTSLVAIVAVGCAKQDDYNALSGRVDGIEGRVNVLEQAVKELNTQTIPSLQAIVKALQEGVTVTSVAKNEEAGTVTITFSNGQTATIKNGEKGEKGDKGDKGDKGEDGVDGKDGENGKDGVDGKDGENGKDGVDGQDGTTPDISIKYIAGTGWVWVINGVEQKDEQGNYIPVVSDPTATPKFKIEDGSWYVSYDGGKTYERVGLVSNTESSIFVEEETEEYIRINVNGSKLDIPKEKPFKLVISYEGDLGSVGVNQNQSLGIAYSIEGVAEGDDVTVDVLSTTAGISAKITKTDFKSGYILITTTDVTSGKVFVYADNNKGKTNIKSITLEEGVLTAVADVQQVPAEGGIIALAVTTNVEYDAVISDGGETWISVEPKTKATHTDDLEIKVEANTTGAYRFATVSVVNRTSGETVAAYDILQQPAADQATDIASIRALKDETAVFANKAIVLASSKEGALVSDASGAYIYVALADNAAVRGDEVSFVGTKKTDADTKLVYVEATSVTTTASAQEVQDLPWQYVGYGEDVNSINTGSTGILKKDDANGKYYIATQYIPHLYFETPLSIDLTAFEGKIVTIKGYTNGNHVELDDSWNLTPDSYYNFILNSVEEVVFEVNKNWTLSYEGEYEYQNYKFENILNTVSAGEDYYANYFFVPQLYPADENLSDADILALAQKEAFRVADDVQFSLSRYNETIADEASNQTGSIYPEAATTYGKFIVFATGLTEEGYVSGKYASLIFEKKDPHVALKYEDFLGDWVVGTNVWTIEANEVGVSYKVKADLFGVSGVEYDGLFVDGKFAFMEKSFGDVGNYTGLTLSGESYSSADDFFGLNVNYADPQPIFYVAALVDGTFEITPNTFTFNEKEYRFNYMELWSLVDGKFSEVKYANIPSIFKPYVAPSANYEDFLGTFTVGSQTWTITEDVNGASYNVAGIPSPIAGTVVKALFTNKSFVLKEQKIEGSTTSSYGSVTDLILGAQFTAGTSNYWSYPANNDEPDVIMTVNYVNGEYPVTAGCWHGNTSYVYKYGYHGTLGEDAGQYAGYSLNYTTAVIPEYFTKAGNSGSNPAPAPAKSVSRVSSKVETFQVEKVPSVKTEKASLRKR